MQIKNRQNHCEEIFPCEGRCFVSALRIVGARSVAVGNVVRKHGTPESLTRTKRGERPLWYSIQRCTLGSLLPEIQVDRHQRLLTSVKSDRAAPINI